MGGVTLLVRSVLRQNRGATAFLVLLLGLPGGIVLGAFEANQRAAGSLERFVARSRSWDIAMEMCPPDVEMSSDDDPPTLRRNCFSPEAGERLLAVLRSLPQVEEAALADPLPFAILDPKAPNGWGWQGNDVYVFRTRGAPLSVDGAVLRSGRWPADDAPDEIAIEETMEHDLGLRIGDTVRFAGWDPSTIDVHPEMRPNTVPFDSKVVGIVRTIRDAVALQQLGPFDADRSLGRWFAGAGWAEAHLDSLGRWSTSGIARLRRGPADVAAVRAGLDAAGWRGSLGEPLGDARPIVGRVIDDERNATAAFAWLGLLATTLLGVLVMRRQFRHELAYRPTLEALGFDRRSTLTATLLRAFAIAGPTALLAIVVGTLATRLTPFGTAGRIDQRGFRFAPMPCALTVLAVVAVVTVAAVAAIRRPARRTEARPMRRGPGAGPSTLVGASMTRGAGPAVATTASAVAVAALLSGAVAVASFDHARREPRTYGAWSDATVNLWTTIGKPAERAAIIRKAEALPGVRDMTLLQQPLGPGNIGDAAVVVTGIEHLGGRPPRLPMRAGRAVVSPDEIVLDLRAARATRTGVGDTVTLTIEGRPYPLRVVGVAYPSPGCGCADQGPTVLVHPAVTAKGDFVSSTLALGFDDDVTDAQVRTTMRSAFGTNVFVPLPPIALTHVGAVRAVPRLIAALVGALAFATLLHALVTLLRKHRRDFAVLSVLGFQRRHHHATRAWAALLLTVGGTIIGVPVGIVAGRRLWRVYVDRLALVPSTRIPLATVLAAPVLAVALAVFVGVVSGRASSARVPLATTLHTE